MSMSAGATPSVIDSPSPNQPEPWHDYEIENQSEYERNKETPMIFESHQIASRTRCHLCGFAEVRTDEVEDRGVVFLAECPRCENRWTSRSPIASHGLVASHGLIESRVPIAAPVRMASRFQRVPARVAPIVAPAA